MINTNKAGWFGTTAWLAAIGLGCAGWCMWQVTAVPVRPSGPPLKIIWSSGPRTIKMTPERWRLISERNALHSKAYMALRDNRYKDAEALARSLIANERRDLTGWEYLARALDEQGRELEARDAYAELLREDTSRCSSRQNDPAIQLRYATLCFRSNKFAQGEYFARKAMAELGRTNTDVARKIPSLPPPPLLALNPPMRQIEATSHLLMGVDLVMREGPRTALREFDAAIKATDDDAIIAAANYQKYRCYCTLSDADRAKLDRNGDGAQKAIRQVALHDRNNGFYLGLVRLTPAELAVNYGNTPDRTYSESLSMKWPFSEFRSH